MLIELNRFLTTDQVRQEYQVPDVLADEVLASLPVVIILEDGTPIHLERIVDDFLSQRYGGTNRQEAAPVVSLNDTEANILEALGNGKLTGEMIAKGAGYPFNSNFKSTLSSLVKRGILTNDRPGYRLARSEPGQD